MKNIFQIVSFHGFFGVEQFQEFLYELWCDVYLERTDFNRLVDYQLQEEFIDSLEMGPGWVHLFLLVNTSLREAEVGLLDVR